MKKNNIRKIREILNIDVIDIANLLNISKYHLYNLEKQDHIAEIYTIKLSKIFECDEDDLTSETFDEKEFLQKKSLRMGLIKKERNNNIHQIIQMPIDIQSCNNTTKDIDSKTNVQLSQFILYIMSNLLYQITGSTQNENDQFIFIQVDGVEMSPVVNNLDMLLVNTHDKIIKIGRKKLMVFKVDNDGRPENIIRYASKDGNGKIQIKDSKDKELNIQNYEIVGHVIKVLSDPRIEM